MESQHLPKRPQHPNQSEYNKRYRATEKYKQWKEANRESEARYKREWKRKQRHQSLRGVIIIQNKEVTMSFD